MGRIFVAGHKGLVGSAVCRRLRADGIEPLVAERSELDLLDQHAVDGWFRERDVDQVYVGIRKKSRTSKLILGSTAQFIILKCKCPVTSVNTN